MTERPTPSRPSTPADPPSSLENTDRAGPDIGGTEPPFQRRGRNDALEHALQRLAAHIDNSPLAVIEFDPGCRVTRWSEGAQRLFGWTAEEVLGRAIGDFRWVHDADTESVRRATSDMLGGCARRLNVNRNYRKDGSIVHCEWHSSAIHDANGRLTSILSHVLDVTERERMENALRRSERRYRASIESMLDGFALLVPVRDAAGRAVDLVCEYINDSGCRMLRRGARQLLGRSLAALLPEIKETGWLANLLRVAESGAPFVGPLSVFLGRSGPDRSPNRVFEVRAVRTEDGLATSWTDVTERTVVEEKLRRKAEELETVLDSVPACIWIAHDPDCRHITGNRAANDLLRLAPGAEASLTAPEDIRPTHFRLLTEERELTGEELPVQRASRGETISNFELSIVFPNATTRHLFGNSMPLYDANSRPRGAVSAFVEVTGRKRAEEALQRTLGRYRLLAMTAGTLLRTRKPREAVERLCKDVLRHLDSDVFFSHLVDRSAGRLRLHAFAGIDAEEARRIAWLDRGGTVCERVLRDGRRIVLERIAESEDEITQLPKSYGLTACACHPLLGTDGRPLGTLSFGTRRRDRFDEDDLALMEAVADQLAAAITRLDTEEELRDSLQDKDVLMRELAHRTKNNMQVIDSLLHLNARALSDERFTAALTHIRERIRAMALVHENLYKCGNYSRLDMGVYLRDVLDSVLAAHRGSATSVAAEMDVDAIALSIDAALPCGLIVTEFVSNSLKHAFANRPSGTIRLSLRRRRDHVELRYRDDGPGIPHDVDFSAARTLGLRLVHSLAVRQLQGTIEMRGDPATEFVVCFRDADPGGGERNRP